MLPEPGERDGGCHGYVHPAGVDESVEEQETGNFDGVLRFGLDLDLIQRCDLSLLHRLTLANVFELRRLGLRLIGGGGGRICCGGGCGCALLLRHLLLQRSELRPHLVQLLLRLLQQSPACVPLRRSAAGSARECWVALSAQRA